MEIQMHAALQKDEIGRVKKEGRKGRGGVWSITVVALRASGTIGESASPTLRAGRCGRFVVELSDDAIYTCAHASSLRDGAQ